MLRLGETTNKSVLPFFDLKSAGLYRSKTPHVADNLLRGADAEKLQPRAPRASLRDLELKLCAESDRTVSKVVQILTEVSAVQTINRNPVVVLIESIQEVGA